jgi:glycerate kinase
MTYAAQKGASAAQRVELENGMVHAYSCIERAIGKEVHAIPGAGAAGGIAAALCAFADARFTSGIDLVMQAWRFSERIKDADLILTGEGRLDGQSASGKVIFGVCRTGQEAGVPVIALAGSLMPGHEQLYQHGLTTCFSICPGPILLDDAIAHAAELISARTGQIMRLWRAAHLQKR